MIIIIRSYVIILLTENVLSKEKSQKQLVSGLETCFQTIDSDAFNLGNFTEKLSPYTTSLQVKIRNLLVLKFVS